MNTTQALMFTTRQAAEQIGVEPSALHRWRSRGTGPRFVRFGRSVRYHQDALNRWVQSHP
jgi:excisionase family DNA binding protein